MSNSLWGGTPVLRGSSRTRSGHAGVEAGRRTGVLPHQYLLSLPERALRSMSALSAGLLREMSEVALPRAVRRTRLYTELVENTLRFLIENVGQVEGAYPPQGKLADNFAMRRFAGNGIELVGLLTFSASPVWVLAALADLSGTGRQLIREIAQSLKDEGLLAAGAEYETMDQLLDGLEGAAGRLARRPTRRRWMWPVCDKSGPTCAARRLKSRRRICHPATRCGEVGKN